jgi:hypothetical protein
MGFKESFRLKSAPLPHHTKYKTSLTAEGGLPRDGVWKDWMVRGATVANVAVVGYEGSEGKNAADVGIVRGCFMCVPLSFKSLPLFWG